ncbi:hypothetical protein P9112_009124 [Eukaryota sp. TZLM1-RC]
MTSRIIVRGFPDTCNEAMLRKHFQHCGEVTDVKVVTNSAGFSRRFGFVGFKDENQASHAVKHLNNSFIGMAKLSVDFARPQGDPNLPRPWSKYTKEKQKKHSSDSSAQPEPPKKKKRSCSDDLRRELWDEMSPQKVLDQIADSGELFLRNLPYSITEDELSEIFSKFGEISALSLPIDDNLSRPKGFATISYLFPKDAVSAYTELDNTYLHGRLLHILPKKLEEDDVDEKRKNAKSKIESFKQAAQQIKQNQAGNAFNWNSLFVRADTAVNATLNNLDVSKEEFLSTDGAVRTALAESSVVAEAKEFLKNNGINLEVLADRNTVQRSNTIILIKNLPIDSTNEDIQELFGRFGPVISVLSTSNNALSIVEMGEPSHAKKAFQKLAYKKFQGQPLYLEFAPIGIKTGGKVEIDDEENSSSTVFVKNLSDETSEDQLMAHLSTVHRPRSVKISKKKHSNEPLGFGFAEFSDRDKAVNVVVRLNNSVLNNCTLSLSLAKEASKGPTKGMNSTLVAVKPKKDQSDAKIIVRNIPFEASRKELKQLFGSFGEIKVFRLPKKFDGTSRGFCFVEFATSDEASRAFEGISAVHFYGRHLVVEWAKKDDGLSLESALDRNQREEEKKEKKKQKDSVRGSS